MWLGRSSSHSVAHLEDTYCRYEYARGRYHGISRAHGSSDTSIPVELLIILPRPGPMYGVRPVLNLPYTNESSSQLNQAMSTPQSSPVRVSYQGTAPFPLCMWLLPSQGCTWFCPFSAGNCGTIHDSSSPPGDYIRGRSDRNPAGDCGGLLIHSQANLFFFCDWI